MAEKVHIVTVATESKYYFPYLKASCERHGAHIEALGMDEKWEGLSWKLKKMTDYLRSIPSTDIVCFVDGYDVICCRDLKELPAEFKRIKSETGCKMIVGHDKTSFLSGFNYLYYGKCRNQSINSGTYVGYAGDLLEIIPKIHAINPTNDTSDQYLMTKYCQRTDDIHCDVDSCLFLTFLRPFESLHAYVEIQDDRVVEYNSNRPFFVHAAGCGFLDELIHALGYDIEVGVISSKIFYGSFKKFTKMHILRLLKEYWLRFLLAFLLIVGIVFVIRRQSFNTKTLRGLVVKSRKSSSRNK